MHFLGTRTQRRELRVFQLGKPYAAVRAKVDTKAKTLVLDPADDDYAGITITKGDVAWVVLPKEYSVLGPDGKKIKQEKKRMFIVSIESFDPYHLIADVPEDIEKH